MGDQDGSEMAEDVSQLEAWEINQNVELSNTLEPALL